MKSSPHNPLIRDPGPMGLGSLAGLVELIIEAAVGLLVLALVAIWYGLCAAGRWVFTSPTHGRAWARHWWSHRDQPTPAGRGGWWGYWWRHRRVMPEQVSGLGGLALAATGAVLLLPAPAVRGPGPGSGRGRGRRRGR